MSATTMRLTILALASLLAVACSSTASDKADRAPVACLPRDASTPDAPPPAPDSRRPDATPQPGTLGARCNHSLACATGLTCLNSEDNALGYHGAPNGLCTAPCSKNADCAAFSATAMCAPFTDAASGYCLEGCTLGPKTAATFDPAKCHGRTDMACWPFSGPSGSTNGCAPVCNTDADCGADLRCDPKGALCTDAPLAKGDPIGTLCTSDATCDGFCMGGTTGTRICSRACVYGAPTGCGWNGTGPADSGCVLVPSTIAASAGIGDYGYCDQLCDCPSDCRAPGFECVQLSSSYTSRFGRAGMCRPPGVSGGTKIECSKDGGVTKDAGHDAKPSGG
jgi:hypothetical protein